MPRILVLWLLALAAACAQASTAQAAPIDDAYDRAEEQLEAGNYEEAAKAARRIIRLAETDGWRFSGYNMLGRALLNGGDPAGAEEAFTNGAAITLANDSLDRGHIQYNLGLALRDQEKHAQSAAAFYKAYLEYRRLAGEHSEHAGDALYHLALQQWSQGRVDKAEEYFRFALTAREKALGADSIGVSFVVYYWGEMLVDAERPAEAIPLYERCLKIEEAEYGKASAEVAFTLGHLATAQSAAGNHENAVASSQRRLSIYEALRHEGLPGAYLDHGNTLRLAERYEEAERTYSRALAYYLGRAGTLLDMNVGNAYYNLGLVAMNLEKPDKAAESFQEAAKIYAEVLGAEHLDVADTLHQQAKALRAAGRSEEAIEPLERAVAMAEKQLAADDEHLLEGRLTLAHVLGEAGYAYEEAEPHLTAILAAREKELGRDSLEMGRLLDDWVVNLYDPSGWIAEAVPLARRVTAIFERRQPENLEANAWAHNNLGFALAAIGERKEAISAYEKSINLMERQFGAEHVNLGKPLHNLSDLLRDEARFDDADAALRRVLRIRTREFGEEDRVIAETLFDLIHLCAARGDFRQAELVLRQWLALVDKAAGAESLEKAELLNDLIFDIHIEYHWFAPAEPLARQMLAIHERNSGPESFGAVQGCFALGRVLAGLNRQQEAVKQFRRALDSARRELGEDDLELALIHDQLARSLDWLSQLEEALAHGKKTVEIRAAHLEEDDYDLLDARANYGRLLWRSGRLEEGRTALRAALAAQEKAWGAEDSELSWTLHDLALLEVQTGNRAAAAKLFERCLALREEGFGKEDPLTAEVLISMAHLAYQEAEFSKSEALAARAVKIYEKALPEDSPELAPALAALANAYYGQGRFRESEPLYLRSLRLTEQGYGDEDVSVADALLDLTDLYLVQARHAEALPLAERSLAIRQRLLGPEHVDTGYALDRLARIHHARSRYADAEPLFRRFLEIMIRQYGEKHSDVGIARQALGNLYLDQARYAEAEAQLRQGLAISEAVDGKDHPFLAGPLTALARLHLERGELDTAEPLLARARQLLEQKLGAEHVDLIEIYSVLGYLELARKSYAAAEEHYNRAIALTEQVYGPDYPDLIDPLVNLARGSVAREDFRKAEDLLDRAITLGDRGGAPEFRFRAYLTRARLSWSRERPGEAIADLRTAMSLAEQQRANFSGAETERAGTFAEFAEAFEQMVAWQAERGDLNEALAAMERARARSLLDEFALAGADLDAGQSAAQREQRKARETALKVEIADIERNLQALAADEDLALEDKQRVAQQLAEKLNLAKAGLYDFYRSARSDSLVYRNLLSVNASPPTVSQLRRQLVGENGLLLIYQLGQHGGYLLSIDAESAHLHALAFTAAQAAALEVEAGPLSAARVRDALIGAEGKGLLTQLKRPDTALAATERLSALYQALIPTELSEQLLAGKFGRLMVVPDGQLALLPFGTLVVDSADRAERRYLLDVGPPIHYGPSATVLYNLLARRTSPARGERVLTLGNPSYPQRGVPAESLLALNIGARYGSVGGNLKPLPHSGVESRWVQQYFVDLGMPVSQLLAERATEAKLREAVAGRHTIHLACHGLADQAYGNFFGALALSPGPEAETRPADDGFLTLGEIYGLDLSSCELAILSACDTNYGPQQRGEGVLAISRGFLVAGSRRVVASNWLVDDEAAASLVGVYCGRLAQTEKKGEQPDYAAALHAAQKWVRGQSKWKSPYYWGTFVLVGPN